MITIKICHQDYSIEVNNASLEQESAILDILFPDQKKVPIAIPPTPTRIVVARLKGKLYAIHNPTSNYCGGYTIWFNGRWTSPEEGKLFPAHPFGDSPGLQVIYDSADLTIGLPEGTEWVSKRYPEIVRRWSKGSVWRRDRTGSWEEDQTSLKELNASGCPAFVRYNPNMSPYQQPDWLAALPPN